MRRTNSYISHSSDAVCSTQGLRVLTPLNQAMTVGTRSWILRLDKSAKLLVDSGVETQPNYLKMNMLLGRLPPRFATLSKPLSQRLSLLIFLHRSQ